ncbi:MAG: cytochrome c3 family protein [Phycisphaerae bacterium]
MLLVGFAAARADDSVVNSKHDLSTSGPGPVRAVNENQVCIFCHTPHNASPAAPLWNRASPRTHYRIYSSSTTDARIDQPTGSSKLCLSCHDGSIALGLVMSRETQIPMSHSFIPGQRDLTNDLSDDHPIGLRYDRQLANRDRELRAPELIDHRVKLGPRGELDCIACHDPHNNELGNFLRIPTRDGALCNTCHALDGWRSSSHATSAKPVPIVLTGGQPMPFASMAENACATCHVPHGAAQSERLLRARAFDLCISCHDGMTGRNVASVIGRRSGHKPRRVVTPHDPTEDPRTMPAHVECVDCHNPHAAQGNPTGQSAMLVRAQGPGYMPTLESVPGVSLTGLPKPDATAYYEVCFRCHADNPVPLPRRVIRDRDEGGNIRRQFQPTAASAHPVTFAARLVAETPSLLPAVRAQPYLSCQDCHNNPDARQLGGSGPNGPHGSPFEKLLVDRYDTADLTIETAQSYALCYRCHDRNSILGDQSFPLHSQHIVRGRAPCSACHAPHGVAGSPREHSHLINFDLAIVSGQRQFVDQGRRAGSCTLTCHGVQHVNFTYGQ